MRRFARLGLFALPLLPAAAWASPEPVQSLPLVPQFGVKLGYMQGERPGVAAGVDFKIPTQPLRFDIDAWSAFQDFGQRDAGTAFTLNYYYRFPVIPLYAGAGLGYVYGRNGDGHFDSVAAKIFVGGQVPFLGAGLEGALLFSDHTVGMVSLVWRV
jgi:hypothetical protein